MLTALPPILFRGRHGINKHTCSLDLYGQRFSAITEPIHSVTSEPLLQDEKGVFTECSLKGVSRGGKECMT